MTYSSGRTAYDKILGYIEKAKAAGGEILIGGNGESVYAHVGDQASTITARAGDDSKGFFIQPTVILTTDPRSVTMTEEIFGPVVTVIFQFELSSACWKHAITQVYVYDDADFEKTLDLIDNTSVYALTGAMWVNPDTFEDQMFSLHIASPLIERHSSLPRTSYAMRLVMCTITRSVQVLLLASNRSVVHVQAERTTKQEASASSIASCRPGASKRTLWGWKISGTHLISFKWQR